MLFTKNTQVAGILNWKRASAPHSSAITACRLRRVSGEGPKKRSMTGIGGKICQAQRQSRSNQRKISCGRGEDLVIRPLYAHSLLFFTTSLLCSLLQSALRSVFICFTFLLCVSGNKQRAPAALTVRSTQAACDRIT